MHTAIKSIAAGVGVAAVLTAGLGVAIQASDDSTSTYISGGNAGETVTMGPASTSLETPSFAPAAKAQVPCGFANNGC